MLATFRLPGHFPATVRKFKHSWLSCQCIRFFVNALRKLYQVFLHVYAPCLLYVFLSAILYHPLSFFNCINFWNLWFLCVFLHIYSHYILVSIFAWHVHLQSHYIIFQIMQIIFLNHQHFKVLQRTYLTINILNYCK